MKIVIFLVLACLSFLSTTSGQDARLAEQYFRDGEFEKSAAMYKSMYGKNPNYNYLEKYTQSLSYLGRKDEAQKVITEAYKRSPHDLYTTILYAVQMEHMGEIEKANSQFRIALKVMDAFEEDFVESKWFKATVYEYTNEQRKEIEKLLAE